MQNRVFFALIITCAAGTPQYNLAWTGRTGPCISCADARMRNNDLNSAWLLPFPEEPLTPEEEAQLRIERLAQLRAERKRQSFRRKELSYLALLLAPTSLLFAFWYYAISHHTA